jgi:hypothetical protein
MSVFKVHEPPRTNVNAPAQTQADSTAAAPGVPEADILCMPCGGSDVMTNDHAKPQIAWPPASNGDGMSDSNPGHKPMRFNR